MERVVAEIDDKLKREFEKKCFKEKRTHKKVIIDLIKKWLGRK